MLGVSFKVPRGSLLVRHCQSTSLGILLSQVIITLNLYVLHDSIKLLCYNLHLSEVVIVTIFMAKHLQNECNFHHHNFTHLGSYGLVFLSLSKIFFERI